VLHSHAHHHQHHHHSPLTAALASQSPFTKAINALERHHHQQQHSHLNSPHHTGAHQSPGATGAHTHHHIMSKIPPLISSQTPGADRPGDLLSGLFTTNKPDAQGCSIGANSPFYDSSPAGAPGAAAPPGLLQMLLNAEKSQELIWNSIRSGTGGAGALFGHLHAGAGISNSIPFGMSRLFDEMSAPQTLFLPPFLSTSTGNLFTTAPVPPTQSSSQSNTPTSSGSASNGSRTPDGEQKSISRNQVFNGIPFPKPLSQLSLTSGGAWDSVHEVTARLLFMVIRWVKCLPTYRTLSKNDQVRTLNIYF
jgi:hypothetical protein